MAHELFISYSRKDNVPRQPGDTKGWVTALRDEILARHREVSTAPLGVHPFYDMDAIKGMNDWRHKILVGLQQSKILLVCLSPDYFKSDNCLWEWEEFHRHKASRLIGHESVAPVYFVEAPDSDEQVNAAFAAFVNRGHYRESDLAKFIPRWKDWHAAVSRYHRCDFTPWFPNGCAALAEEAVKQRLAELAGNLTDRIARTRRAADAPGNLRGYNPHFVGRGKQLMQLHETLIRDGAVGVITAVNGLGGQGKTEFATTYAHSHADSYPGGLWVLAAEDRAELLPLFGELAGDSRLGIPRSARPDETADERGLRVLERMRQLSLVAKQRDPDGGAACLVILDNVSDPLLLSNTQRDTLNLPAQDWLRLVATTRLGESDFVLGHGPLAFLEITSLDEDDAVDLIRNHQPPLDADGRHRDFPPSTASADAAAAREIARELGGFTLAVESVAIYLGLHPEIRPADYLARLRAEGLTGVDTLPADASVAAQMKHREKQLRIVLDQTLEKLTPTERTALDYAALLPPDSIPWPWLRALVEQEHSNALAARPGYEDPWVNAKRRLVGLRLLTPGDYHEYHEITRMHRLISSHMRSRLSTVSLRQRALSLEREISGQPPTCPASRVESVIVVGCVSHLAAVGETFIATQLLRKRLLSTANHFCGTKQFALLTEIAEVCAVMLKDTALPEDESAFLLLQRGYCARALGRTRVALESFELCLQVLKNSLSPPEAVAELKSIVGGLLATTHLYAGDLQTAESWANEAIRWAEQTRNRAKLMYAFSTLGKVQMQRGNFAAASESLGKSISLIHKIDLDREAGVSNVPIEPGNVSNAQFRYGELLLDQGEFDIAEKLADSGIERLNNGKHEPMSIGLLEAVKAWAIIKQDVSRVLRDQLDTLTRRTLDDLKDGRLDTETIRGHLLRAEFHALYGDTASAVRELNYADELARRGDFQLHIADMLLARVRHFARAEPYPWEPSDSRTDWNDARCRINACGYFRRNQALIETERLLP